jgi:hypothetical protein
LRAAGRAVQLLAAEVERLQAELVAAEHDEDDREDPPWRVTSRSPDSPQDPIVPAPPSSTTMTRGSYRLVGS